MATNEKKKRLPLSLHICIWGILLGLLLASYDLLVRHVPLTSWQIDPVEILGLACTTIGVIAGIAANKRKPEE